MRGTVRVSPGNYAAGSRGMPVASIVVPCYNEQPTICLLLEAVYNQTYPREQMEVIVADGGSSDGTREAIRGFCEAHPDLRIRVVENPQRIIPAALNRAIAAAGGKFIVRLDAHSAPQPDYVARCVAALEAGLGTSVGGVWDIRSGNSSWMARAIAAAAAHPLGVGDARYRYTTRAGSVDTVPFGAFPRALIDQMGPFDETLLTNEDYEFNTRIRRRGGTIWLDPQIRSVYFARSDLGALARQYWRYGYWKVRMLRRYPGSIRWRQALPPVFVLSLLGLAAGAVFSPAFRWLLAGELGVYAGVLLVAGFLSSLQRMDFAYLLGLPLAIAVMHLFWGSGFLWSLVRK